jgi:hypothetical protein
MKKLSILILIIQTAFAGHAQSFLSAEFGKGLDKKHSFNLSIVKEKTKRINFGVEAEIINNQIFAFSPHDYLLFVGPVATSKITTKRNFSMISAVSLKGAYDQKKVLIQPGIFLRQYFHTAPTFRIHLTERLSYFPSKILKEFYPTLAAGITFNL